MNEHYIARKGVAGILRRNYSSAWYLHATGAFIDPDVYVGDVPGWSRDRVVQFGIDAGYINTEGDRIMEPSKRHLEFRFYAKHGFDDPPPYWHQTAQRFLSATQMRESLGLTHSEWMYRLRIHKIREPDVYVGRLAGWRP
jgi:hypothetical protein